MILLVKKEKKEVIVVDDFTMFLCRTVQRRGNSLIYGLDDIVIFH